MVGKKTKLSIKVCTISSKVQEIAVEMKTSKSEKKKATQKRSKIEERGETNLRIRSKKDDI